MPEMLNTLWEEEVSDPKRIRRRVQQISQVGKLVVRVEGVVQGEVEVVDVEVGQAEVVVQEVEVVEEVGVALEVVERVDDQERVGGMPEGLKLCALEMLSCDLSLQTLFLFSPSLIF